MCITCSKSGFTLIELSIVLVIVGLLIGGILIGRSLIESASISSTASQIQRLDGAVAVFRSKYRAIPGDAAIFSGNGNSIIDWARPGQVASMHNCESASFWRDIMPDKFAGQNNCNNPGAQIIISGENKNNPASSMGKSNSAIIASALVTANTENADQTSSLAGNYYAILDNSQGQTIIDSWYRFEPTDNINSAVKPANLLSLDAKIDDGIANEGVVISGKIGARSGFAYGGIEATPAAGLCSSGSDYILTSSNYECTPVIRIGGQVGERF